MLVFSCTAHAFDTARSERALPLSMGDSHPEDEELFTTEHQCLAALKALEQIPNITQLSVAQMQQSSGCTSKSFNYAEAGLNYFALCLERSMQHTGLSESGGNFYDIGESPPSARLTRRCVGTGSGFGKITIAASWLRCWDRCIGVELVEGMVDSAQALLSSFKDGAVHVNQEQKTPLERVEFHHADLSQFDWSDGDVILCNSLVFEPPTMQVIHPIRAMYTELTMLGGLQAFTQQVLLECPLIAVALHELRVQAERLKPGSLVLTSQQIESEHFIDLGMTYDCFDPMDLCAIAEFDFFIQRRK